MTNIRAQEKVRHEPVFSDARLGLAATWGSQTAFAGMMARLAPELYKGAVVYALGQLTVAVDLVKTWVIPRGRRQ
jgi:hypothetical protein